MGREALAARALAGPSSRLIGLVSRSRRIPRHGHPVLLDGQVIGTVTSGAPSPTVGWPIAMAYVRPDAVDAVGAAGTAAADPAGAARPAEAARAVGTAASARDAGETATGAGRLAIDVRGRAEPADFVQLPFYRRAK